jgi:hypothetical protein
MGNRLAVREYRYERKFLIDEMDRHQVRAAVLLHPALFAETYPPRFVNNIYLDTATLENYADNVSGAGKRIKVRVRWYGEFFGEAQRPALEFKIRSGYVGAKAQYALDPFIMDGRFNRAGFCAWLRGQPRLPAEVQARLAGLEVALLNRYRREYYETRDHRFRLTLDSGLTFYRAGWSGSHFLHRRTAHRLVIVEMKYNVEHDTAAQRITARFPFRLSRSSKYVQGIEQLIL